ncbi:MAG: DUF721 domain-containing protein [Caldithrix sp.]|nr:DUF721 domain-containing protein [Caldithrix sp.]
MAVKKDFKSMHSVLYKVLGKYNLKEPYFEKMLRENWEYLIEPPLNKVSEPVKLENQVLTLRAKSNAWKQELINQKMNVIQWINRSNLSVRIKDIKLI